MIASKVPFNVFLDSDGPIADFKTNLELSGESVYNFKHAAGTYLWLPITAGAEYAIKTLRQHEANERLKVWVLTKTPSGAPYAYTEKVLWYRRNFPWLENRVILTHDKSIVGSKDDFLLDDRPHKANAEKFPGTFVLFKEDSAAKSWGNFLLAIEDRLF